MVSDVPITGEATGCPANSALREGVGQGVLRVVVAHGDLFQDHLALGVDVGGRDRRVQHHVADQLDGELRLLGRESCA